MKLFYTFPVFIILVLTYSTAEAVVINEAMSSNGSTIADQQDNFNDWIELYNSSDNAVNISNYYLSDDKELLTKWQIGSVSQISSNFILKPGEFLLIWASGKNQNDPRFQLHTNFKLNRTGDELYLTKPDGIEIADMVVLPLIPRDHSYGRKPDGGDEWFYFINSTPANPNISKAYNGMAKAPVFSKKAGFYNEKFELILSYNDPNALIIYTLDGSEPDTSNLLSRIGKSSKIKRKKYEPDTSNLLSDNQITLDNQPVTYVYNSAIIIQDRTAEKNILANINTTHGSMPHNLRWRDPDESIPKSTVVRAKTILPDALASKTETHTYFVYDNAKTFHNGLMVISISTSIDNFFGFENGIYIAGQNAEGTGGHWGLRKANFQMRGRDWERPGNIEFFETDGRRVINQNAGFRIHGNISRSQPLKSLRIYARADHDTVQHFNHVFFPGQGRNLDNNDIQQFKRLILRNSGQDFYDSYNEDNYRFGSMMKDGLNHMIIAQTNSQIQKFRPAVHYINGEYWGIINIRERIDRFYIENNFDLDPDKVSIIDNENLEISEGNWEDMYHYHLIKSFAVDNDMSDQRNFDSLKNLIDIENYIDYYITQIQAGHKLLGRRGFNMWRYRTDSLDNISEPHPADGRYRWITFDMEDYSFISHANTLLNALNPAKDINSVPLRHIIENESFKTMFLNRYADLLNTIYLPTNIYPVIDHHSTLLENEILNHINRWRFPIDKASWDSTIAIFYNWADERPDFMRSHIIEHFDLNGLCKININVNNSTFGSVKINSILISPKTPGINENPYPWSGKYFKELLIPIEAIPEPGYYFEKWAETKSTEPLIYIKPGKDVKLTAVFKKNRK